MGAVSTTKVEPKTKVCTGACGKRRKIKFFRVLSSGYLQGMCVDCERAYERDRWHTRSVSSRATAGKRGSRSAA
jgi:hypothetical protein